MSPQPVKPLDLVRIFILDRRTDGSDAACDFKDQEIQALLNRYGDNPERVAGYLWHIIAADSGKAGGRAQTLNLTIESYVEQAHKAGDRYLELADKTEAGGFGQDGPKVTRQGQTGRLVGGLDRKGIPGIGVGVVKDSDAEATDELEVTPDSS